MVILKANTSELQEIKFVARETVLSGSGKLVISEEGTGTSVTHDVEFYNDRYYTCIEISLEILAEGSTYNFKVLKEVENEDGNDYGALRAGTPNEETEYKEIYLGRIYSTSQPTQPYSINKDYYTQREEENEIVLNNG